MTNDVKEMLMWYVDWWCGIVVYKKSHISRSHKYKYRWFNTLIQQYKYRCFNTLIQHFSNLFSLLRIVIKLSNLAFTKWDRCLTIHPRHLILSSKDCIANQAKGSLQNCVGLLITHHTNTFEIFTRLPCCPPYLCDLLDTSIPLILTFNPPFVQMDVSHAS
jgi:hypothetical protein